MVYFNIYDKSETEFNHNEFIIKDVKSATLTEEINGIFNLDMEVLMCDSNINMICVGNVIKAAVPDDREWQLFRITNVKKTLYSITIVALNIATSDLSVNFIADANVVGKNRVGAVNHLLRSALQENRFICVGPDSGPVNNLRVVRYNPISAIFGDDDNTVLNRYGGEFRFDNFTIHAADAIGTDNGVIISYKKNMTSIDESINDSDLVTRIIPQGTEELLLPEYYIDSPKINDYEKVYHRHMSFDIGVVEPSDDTEGVTKEQAIVMLRKASEDMFKVNNIDTLFFNYKINFIELSATDEYKDYAALETVNLGDTVRVLAEHLGLTLNGRVYKYKYDLLKKVYDELEIGNKRPDISSSINQTNAQINMVKQSIKFEVASLNSSFKSSLEILDNKITSKVSADEVDSIITQSPNAVTIAFNDYTDVITLMSDGLKVSHKNGDYSKFSANGIERYNSGMKRPYKYINYAIKVSQVHNGQWTKVYLLSDFKNKQINDDFLVTAWAGDVDSNVNAAKQKDAIRRLFIEVGTWNPDECSLMVRPCLQKIGIATMTMFGWDSATTTPGNPIGEGAVDVILLCQM